MDNPINISDSYFINKSNIKNRNKKRHRLIKQYEKVKTIVKNEPWQTKETSETIEMITKRIKMIKEEINIETSIYLY